MMNCRLGQTAQALTGSFYNPHGQSSKLSFPRGKPMSFQPIGVKRVRSVRRSGRLGDDGGNAPIVATDNLGEDAALIHIICRGPTFGSYSVICWYGPFPIAPLIQLGGSSLSPQASRARRQPR